MAEERERVRGRRKPRPRTDVATPAPTTTPTTRRRDREPRLARGQPRGVVAVTTEFLGLSSAKRVAVLALVVCALALTVAVPLRNYVTQRQELAEVSEQQQALAAEVDQLTAERARLSDPTEIAAQARSRLGYVTPGEVPYVVQFPSSGAEDAPPQVGDGLPWYRALWRDVSGEPR
jgi:cell division protein FtsB